jgi:NAD(P)-dependent dehydrogenase (short-subunit alcohol dehydrogenase family)
LRVLITGTNRGLGLEFVKQLLARGEEVIATCRKPEEAGKLHELKKKFGESLTICKLDSSIQDSVNNAFDTIKQKIPSLDLLINNAGIISGDNNRHHAFGDLYAEEIKKTFQVNTIGPVLIMQMFFPLLKKGNNPKIANISSRMGSISLKGGSSTYSYDASKAALNMFSKALAYNLKSEKISVLILHPGWVKTDMGTQRASITPQMSVKGMIRVIDAASLSDSGKFLDWEGNVIPW